MNAAVVQSRAAVPSLKDPTLFRDRCLVGGEWVEADNRARINVDNPADGELIGTVPDCGAAETRRAIAAAAAAL
ncbi:MAG: aldehyde dehydrogenase family protein, partial [Burkholderiales bacterium]|nr:aldehyde dehydrogenase family protein [Burkholderiales bacterium]